MAKLPVAGSTKVLPKGNDAPVTQLAPGLGSMPSVERLGGKGRRALRVNEIGLPLAGDTFEYSLPETLDVENILIPKGTVVTRRISEAKVAAWIGTPQPNSPEGMAGFWAFEIATGTFLHDEKAFWVIATPTPGHWREIILDAQPPVTG